MTIDNVVKIFSKVFRPWRQRILLMIGRGVLLAAKDTDEIQKLQIALLADEVKSDVESMAHFGFASVPPKSSDVIMVSVGSNREHGVVIASESREHRLKGLSEGEAGIYSKDGKYLKVTNENIEALVSKIKIENSSNEAIATVSEFMDKVINGKVITSVGPQPWTPDTKLALQAEKDKFDTFKV